MTTLNSLSYIRYIETKVMEIIIGIIMVIGAIGMMLPDDEDEFERRERELQREMLRYYRKHNRN